ncbi:MAG: RNA 3'-phosphate cyclase [Candidatus Dadabacteria bacterium]|nr:RNA 3'-phosphate cyclase [Candidatus Dadabacteria bacterium]
MDIIEIDGSFGEGGGQILRTSLSLSILAGKPFEMINIRAKREKPGLRPQHLASVHSAARISSAYVDGGEPRSLRLRFIPKNVKSGGYEFDIGTAGAVSLVFQTVFFPLALKGKSSSIVSIRGGTHVPLSPSIEFLEEEWLLFMKRIGFRGDVKLKRAGFYPKGGGELITSIEPVESISPLELKERGDLLRVFGISAVGGLSKEVAERGRERVLQILRENNIPNVVKIRELPSFGRGAIVFLKTVFENTMVSHSALGEIGKRMEAVAEEACQKMISFLKGDATVDENMGDQLTLPLSLATGRSFFKVPKITSHLKTNAEVVKRFLHDVKIQFERNEVTIEGIGRGAEN